ncbi:hypothetical protein OAV24_02495 [Gammaproteobacteria bacterium]|nr:hypothetical protein [Gammaproteobacteria bacterium]
MKAVNNVVNNPIDNLYKEATSLVASVSDLNKSSKSKLYDRIPYGLQDILDAQLSVNQAVDAMLEDVNEWRPELLDPELMKEMVRDPKPEVIAMLEQRIEAREIKYIEVQS